MAFWRDIQQQVFSGSLLSAWTPLDLSSEVGSKRVLVLLLIRGTTGTRIAFRPGGDADDWNALHGGRGGFGTTYVRLQAGIVSAAIIETNASGIIEYYCNNVNAGTIELYGFIDDVLYSGVQIYNGVHGPTWRQFDISAEIGTVRALAWLKYKALTDFATTYAQFRMHNYTLSNWIDSSSNTKGPFRIWDPLPNKTAGVFGITNTLGVFEAYKRVNNDNVDIELHSWIPEGDGLVVTGQKNAFPLGVPPTSWDELDLSSFVGGQKRVLAFLRVITGFGVTGNWVRFRPGGSSENWGLNTTNNNYSVTEVGVDDDNYVNIVIVPTDENGKVEWESNPFGASGCPIQIDVWGYIAGGVPPTGEQKTLNSVEVTFDAEPLHIDPNDPLDATNIDNYVVTGPVAPLEERIIQAITYEGDSKVLLWFDGPLVAGETYSIAISNVADGSGGVLAPAGSVVEFVAFDLDAETIPLRLETADTWDIANPQLERDSQGHSLGTYSANEEGDLVVEARRASLRKRILRRCTTALGAFAHLENYGLSPRPKRLARSALLRQLKLDAEAQVKSEPDVIGVRATVSEEALGVYRLSLVVQDRYGSFNLESTIGAS